jgi:uncharacterized membrane protein YeaQ/YmgE (transglycosylase-associated protein family)
MSVLGWILLGLVAGFIGSKIVNRTGQGFLLDIVLGIVGAVVGGFLFSAIGAKASPDSTFTACSSPLWVQSSCSGATAATHCGVGINHLADQSVLSGDRCAPGKNVIN